MILACDECNARYLVPGHAIGPEGRRVRCTNCNYEWFQEGDEPQGPEDDFGPAPEEELPDPEDIEPIPESVKPVPEGSSVPALPEEGRKSHSFDPKVFAGYSAAAAIFLLILGSLLLTKNTMVKLWPASMAFYELVGMKTPVDGEDLIFDQLAAVVSKDENGVSVLKINADILNLARKSSHVPYIRSSLLQENGDEADSWITTPLMEVIEKEGEMAFETTYPHISSDVKEVNVRFVLDSSAHKENKPGKENKKTDEH